MNTDNRTVIKTTLFVYKDERGIETILPTPEEALREVALVEKKIAEQTQLLESPDMDKRREAQARLEICQQVLVNAQAIRDHFLPNSEPQDFYLVRPTQGQMNKFRTQPGVRIERPDGTVVLNQDALKESMLTQCLEGKSREQVLALAPDIYERLFAELWRVCYPSSADLDFMQWQLSPH